MGDTPEFIAGDGKSISDEDARILGPIFQRMAAQGRLTATDIVHEASQAASPLRRFFEWDNLKAAHEHRLYVARGLIRAVLIPTRSADELGVTRAFVAIPRRSLDGNQAKGVAGERPQFEYVTREEAKDTEWMREHLRRKAIRAIRTWQSEYRSWAKDDRTFQPALKGIEESSRLYEEEEKVDLVEAA